MALLRSRELTEAAAPGGGLAAATVLGLALAWANVVPPGSAADFELPFLVRPRSPGRPRGAALGTGRRMGGRGARTARNAARRALERAAARRSRR